MQLFDWNDIFSQTEAHLCAHMHIHTSCLANFRWARSPSTESAQKDCATAEERMIYLEPSYKKRIALTLEFLHHISNVQRPPRSHVVPLQRRWQRWITDVQKILYNCPGWDIPSATPTQLSPNFTAGTSPTESQVAYKDKQVLLSSGSASSS